MLDPYVADWLGLVTRWFHFMMGVAWIGASFYFVWLNNTVRPPPEARSGVAGELWAVHGGAFYQVTKYGGAPEKLPETLHWFKWEAYLTWLSGFVLLLLHYWLDAGRTMVDPAIGLSPAAAVGVGATALVGGWLVYDGLCRSPLKDRPTLLALLLVTVVTGVAWGLSQLLPARVAYLHTGAMLGTWMAANVLFVIIPGQRAMVDAMIAGTPPPLHRGKAGALRSLHNNYLTLPVLFVMISGHFPGTWGHPRGWAILAGLGLVGAAWRHWVNQHERGNKQNWILGALLAGLVLIAVLARPTRPAQAEAAAVPITRVQQVVAARCLSCHATEPVQPGFITPPKGLVLEEPRQIRAAAGMIYQQVAVARAMPPANLTGLTEEERELLGRWAAAEAAP